MTLASQVDFIFSWKDMFRLRRFLSARRITALLVIAVITFSLLGVDLYTATRPSNFTSTQTITVSTAPLVKPCSIQIGMNGSYTFMEDCGTGSILFHATNPAPVFDDAIDNLTGGGKIFVKAGTYTFMAAPVNLGVLFGGTEHAAIGTTSINNIELYGEGNATILAAGTNLNAMVIGTNGVGGWYIHDLQVNGNRASQSGTGGSAPYLMCVMLSGGDGNTVENLYVHDCKTHGIWVGSSSYDMIANNLVVDSNANGIVLEGSYSKVSGNTVSGTSDAGIDLSGPGGSALVGDTAYANKVLNANLGVSPFGLNTAWGISVGDTGYVNDSVVSQNFVSGAKNGIISEPVSGTTDYGLMIAGNTVLATSATNDSCIELTYTQNTTISDGYCYGGYYAVNIAQHALNLVFSGDSFLNYYYYGLYFGSPSIDNVVIAGNIFRGSNAASSFLPASGDNNFTITNNQFMGVSATVGCRADICVNGQNQWITIDNNVFREPASAGTPVELVHTQHFTVNGNLFDEISPGNGGAILLVSDRYGTISNNDFYGWYNTIEPETGETGGNITISTNTFEQSTYAIYGTSTKSDYLNIVGNTFTGGTSFLKNPIDLGNHTIIMNNVGYNPIGKVTNFTLTGGTSQPGDDTYISPFGTSSTLSASTTYKITTAPCRITFQTAGSNVSVSIDDRTGFTPTIGDSIYLYPGETINLGAFSTAPTLQLTFT